MDQTALYLAVTLIMEESVRRNAIAKKIHAILLQDVWCMVRNHIYQSTNPCTRTLIVLSPIHHPPYNVNFTCITWHSLTQEKSPLVQFTLNDRVRASLPAIFHFKFMWYRLQVQFIWKYTCEIRLNTTFAVNFK